MGRDATSIWPVVRAERTALAADLATLEDAQWEASSLCDGWRVRDVVAHMAGRPAAISDLTGEGVATLSSRMTA